MGKQDFINKLEEITGLSTEQATIVNEVMENHGLIGAKSKEAVVQELEEKLQIDAAKADEIYNKAHDIIGGALKDKLLHPFG